VDAHYPLHPVENPLRGYRIKVEVLLINVRASGRSVACSVHRTNVDVSQTVATQLELIRSESRPAISKVEGLLSREWSSRITIWHSLRGSRQCQTCPASTTSRALTISETLRRWNTLRPSYLTSLITTPSRKLNPIWNVHFCQSIILPLIWNCQGKWVQLREQQQARRSSLTLAPSGCTT
jgi:hypothetical protein